MACCSYASGSCISAWTLRYKLISKLPRWIEYGSFLLALIAGMVNAIGILGVNSQSLSHLSGTATLFGSGILTASNADLLHLFLVIMSFLFGAAVSGFFLNSGALKLGRNYSRLLFLEAILLAVATFYLLGDSFQGHYFASIACGLQNALVTTYSGAVIRTTHVTGIFTDLGLMLGARVRGEALDKRKTWLLILIILGFIAGGTIGAYSFAQLSNKAMLVPALMCLFLAVSYAIYNAKTGEDLNT